MRSQETYGAGQRPRWTLAAVGAMLGVVAVAGAYGTLRDPKATHNADARRGAKAVLRLSGAFGAEIGPDGHTWRWIGSRAGLELNGEGRRWLAFRAKSLNRTRTLTVRDGQVVVGRFRLPVVSKSVLLGPIDVTGGRALHLIVSPGAEPAPGRDRRELAVFFSDISVSRIPFAALPGRGFWPRETTKLEGPFNWLARTGRVAILTPRALARVRLRFSAVSAGGISRTLVVTRSGELLRTVTVPADKPVDVDLPSIEVTGGRGHVRLSSNPGPQRYGNNRRALSVKITRLRASLPEG